MSDRGERAGKRGWVWKTGKSELGLDLLGSKYGEKGIGSIGMGKGYGS